ncbi:hypothetical protein ANCCAN_13510 [Ancylostoma caninum]|uniref:Ubiquitin-like domain-containing protein n=1 Tax=Ancylostoma caninum TaxID=29170 RepID=A0A368GBY7_ANCCA|nr:hypothetical protein ANCCAN_13510 [Ancylostoma caninum]
MTSVAGASSETVELTVRCAFQTSKDINVVCPLYWTIRHLKEHLHQVCPSHPAVTSQRLIFSGACLTDDMVIKDVMDQRKVVDGPQVLHLVCPLPQSSPTELRQRHTATARQQSFSPIATTPAQQNAGSSPTTTNYYEWYQRYYGSSSPEQLARLQQFSDYYAAYINQWQQYQSFMMGQMGYSPSTLGEMLQAQQTPIPVAQAVFTRNDQQPPVDVVPNQANGIVNEISYSQIPAEPNVAAAVPGGGRDVLDIIYKVFRVVLLLSAVMLYSSLERFLAVLTIALFIFFIQLRRNYQRQARMADPPEQNVNNNNAGEQPQDAAEQAPAYIAAAPPSGIQVFFATCYSFITSFFTSLIPDHPVPVDLN